MYDGYQVLRFENNYKNKDLYLIGNEMNNRVGTGNYDKERIKFNIKYKELEKDNLYQDVKYKLESRNIEYLHKTKTNLLNGVTISSGPEFFMTLGLPFKETDRKYKTGKKEGQNIWTPDIKSKDDKITSLSIENDFYKNNRKLIKSEKIRHEQSKELSNKDEELKYYKNAFSKVTRALDIITKRRPMPYIRNYVSFAESVMAGKRAREMDEKAQREFDEANKKGEDIWP